MAPDGPTPIHTYCPLDGTDDADVEVYPANWDLTRLDPSVFSARRMPDRIHYRMVRNRRTGCLRADPVLDERTVLGLYRASDATGGGVSGLAADTYARLLVRVLSHLPDRRGVLEVGCGDGAFLERVQPLGFGLVRGLEPSRKAAASAAPAVRSCIIEGVLGPGSFPAESFSLVCGFQVLDHLLRPNDVLSDCMRLLAPGGVMFWICHDVGWWLPRLLGRYSPILDIEHVVLYDRATVRKLFEKNGYETIEVFGVRNRYPLGFWMRLAPVPAPVKPAVLRFLEATRAGRVMIDTNLGNLGIIARKPAA